MLPIQDGLPPPPGVDPNRPSAGTTRSIFDVNFRDAYAQNWNVNLQQALGTNYALEVAYVGSRGRQMMLKGDPNQAQPPTANEAGNQTAQPVASEAGNQVTPSAANEGLSFASFSRLESARTLLSDCRLR